MSVSVCPLPGAASGMSGASGKRQETAALVQRMNSSGVVVQFLATCMVVEKHWDHKELLALWVYQVSEWMSFFMVTYLAQWTSHLFLVLALVIMYILAVLRAGSFLQPFMRPIYMFLPERHSYFGLCNSQESAMVYQLVAAALRVGSFLLWLVMAINMPSLGGNTCTVPVVNFHNEGCNDVPLWLSSGCGIFFDPDEWQRCVSASWIEYGYCNLLAAQCRNQSLGPFNLAISIFFNSSLSLTSILAPFIWLAIVGGLSWFKGFCIFNVPPTSQLNFSLRETEIELTGIDPDQYSIYISPSLRRLIRFDLVLSIVDVASDFLCVFVFLFALNWGFALLQVMILLSIPATLSAFKEKYEILWKELQTAYKMGVVTESYLSVVLSERIRRCPLSLFLQFYGACFVTSNMLVATVFTLSITSSLLSAVQGGFFHIHMNLNNVPWSLIL